MRVSLFIVAVSLAFGAPRAAEPPAGVRAHREQAVRDFLTAAFAGGTPGRVPIADTLTSITSTDDLTRLRKSFELEIGPLITHGDIHHVEGRALRSDLYLAVDIGDPYFGGRTWLFSIWWRGAAGAERTDVVAFKTAPAESSGSPLLHIQGPPADLELWAQFVARAVPERMAPMFRLLLTDLDIRPDKLTELVFRKGRIVRAQTEPFTWEGCTVPLRHERGRAAATFWFNAAGEISFFDIVKVAPLPPVVLPEEPRSYTRDDESIVTRRLEKVREVIDERLLSIAPVRWADHEYYKAGEADAVWKEVTGRIANALKLEDYEAVAATVERELQRIGEDIRFVEIPQQNEAVIQPVNVKSIAVVEAPLFRKLLTRIDELLANLTTHGFFLTVLIESSPRGATTFLQVGDSKASRRKTFTRAVINLARGIYHLEMVLEGYKPGKLEEVDLFHQSPSKIVCELVPDDSTAVSQCRWE